MQKSRASFAIANDISLSVVEQLRVPVLHHLSLDHRAEPREPSRSLQIVPVRVLEANTPLHRRPRTCQHRKDTIIPRLPDLRPTRHPGYHPPNMRANKPIPQLTGNAVTLFILPFTDFATEDTSMHPVIPFVDTKLPLRAKHWAVLMSCRAGTGRVRSSNQCTFRCRNAAGCQILSSYSSVSLVASAHS